MEIVTSEKPVVVLVEQEAAILIEQKAVQNIITEKPSIITVVEGIKTTVTTETTGNIVQEQPYTQVVVQGGVQGPRGIPGVPGDSDNYIYLITAEAIGGHRAVTSSVAGLVYANTTSTNILGISVSSVSSGQLAQIQISGVITEPSWNWIQNSPIFVSDNGLLTQQVPETGALFIIGYPVLSTQIFIDKQAPILLG